MSERQGVPPSDADEAETRVKEGPSDLAPAGQAPIGLAGGTMVDHFELVRPLGRGATGAVYLARDTQLGRKVAIKMVLPKLLGSERDLQRFVREARTTARFSHPHIVAVYAVGEHAGAPYVALEYLEGEDLRQRLLARRLGRQEALRVAHAVADAMAEAHRHGVLHRDLKPGNVVLPTDGRVRVVDFGLARIEQDAMVASSRFDRPPTIDGEQTDGVQGTPAYMAPELWTEGACSRASDVWAFGVMLHEMWAGARPFRGPGMVDLIADICGPQPAPAVDGPPELGALVARCLDKDPTERPSAEEVRDRLHALLHRAGPDVAVTDCPFRGLLPFTERDAAVFFGREAEVAAFVEQVRLQAVLPVIGASGAGKSSLVHAGVIARLREQQSWLVATVRPGARPLRTLAARLLQPVPPASQSGSGISVLSDSGLGPPRPSRPLTASAAAKRPARARGEPGDDDAIASTLLAAVPWSGT
jgi:tRNA A-37 threonylcarbamoyl transferase component Bud32